MAKLEDLMPELKGSFNGQNGKRLQSQKNAIGRKRRAWIDDSNEKGSIDTIDKHHSNIIHNKGFELTGEKGFINPIHKPYLLCLADLRSNPLKLIKLFFSISEKINEEYETRRVRLSDVMLTLNISKDSARTALRFLLKNNLLTRIEYQAGVHGWSRYKIQKSISLEINTALKKGLIEPSDAIDRSRKKNKENYKEQDLLDINENDWNNVDITPLEKIGFKNQHILQVKNKITPELLQESINHFTFGLQNNPKVKKYSDPLATFISVLKRGESWIEPNYRSRQELAQEELLRIKKAELERMKQLEDQARKIAFDEWQQYLSTEEIEGIAPSSIKRQFGEPSKEVKLSRYFKEYVWPKKKSQYLITTD